MVLFCGAPSLTRGRVCVLYMLLTLASAVFLRSEFFGTRDHILLSQILGKTNRLLFIDKTDRVENNASNNTSIVACVFVVVGMSLWSHWLATIGGYTDAQTVSWAHKLTLFSLSGECRLPRWQICQYHPGFSWLRKKRSPSHVDGKDRRLYCLTKKYEVTFTFPDKMMMMMILIIIIIIIITKTTTTASILLRR
jgi:hypothetical protein